MEIINYRPTMRYREFGQKTHVGVSMLGFGAMRLPLRDGTIDAPRAIELLETGFSAGINYVDTAYVYQEGESERIVGCALNNGWRDRIQVATKLPLWEIRQPGDQVALFETQLRRLQTEKIDFYLLHALNKRYWKIVKEAHLLDWLSEEKRRGRMRFAGFSFHDDFELFKEVVDAYDWDFCQIQYNYAQEHVQAGVRGLRHAASKGLGVVIMEPLFGGFLARPQLPPGASLLFETQGVDPVASALRWIWHQPEVSLVLSGMSDLYQLKDNLRTVETAEVGCLPERERRVLDSVCQYIREHVKIGCSACRYCVKQCPVGIKIPEMFDLYNTHVLLQCKHSLQSALYRSMLPHEKASACIACGQCKAHCPQALDIPEWLKKVAEMFETK